MARRGQFQPGQSGNPSGRPRRQIENLANEARKLTSLALGTLEQICRGEMPGVTPRDRLAAANAILDRGHGKPIAPVDLLTINRKVDELSDAEFAQLDARLVAAGIIQADDHEESVH